MGLFLEKLGKLYKKIMAKTRIDSKSLSMGTIMELLKSLVADFKKFGLDFAPKLEKYLAWATSRISQFES